MEPSIECVEEVRVARRKTRRVVVVVLAVFAVLAAVAIPVGLKVRADAATTGARVAAEGFARAWRTGTITSVHFQGATSADAAKRIAAATAGLTPGKADRPAAVEADRPPEQGQ